VPRMNITKTNTFYASVFTLPCHRILPESVDSIPHPHNLFLLG
jgi:hypothetical protein